MKQIILFLLAALLLLGLVSCGGNTAPDAAETGTTAESGLTPAEVSTEDAAVPEPDEASPENVEAAPENTPDTEETEPPQTERKVLVVVFSATGTTKGVAEKIAALEDADLYEIKAAQEYTSDDLNWNDSSSRTTLEQNDKSARPEIGSESISLEGYEKIYIGFPIWWGEEPRILDTFVESCDFDGITVIPFCTSGGSGIGRSGQNLAENAGSGNWLEGKRFSGSVTESDLQAWIDGLQA
ncbi:MAG: flavodoxin [Oscillospiraceae bacterium]|nr:flavodoxin [Oscillospiraceae bacterium]